MQILSMIFQKFQRNYYAHIFQKLYIYLVKNMEACVYAPFDYSIYDDIKCSDDIWLKIKLKWNQQKRKLLP